MIMGPVTNKREQNSLNLSTDGVEAVQRWMVAQMATDTNPVIAAAGKVLQEELEKLEKEFDPKPVG